MTAASPGASLPRLDRKRRSKVGDIAVAIGTRTVGLAHNPYCACCARKRGSLTPLMNFLAGHQVATCGRDAADSEPTVATIPLSALAKADLLFL